MSGYIFPCYNWSGECYWHQAGGGQEAAKYPKMRRTAFHNKGLLSPNVSSAEVEKCRSSVYTSVLISYFILRNSLPHLAGHGLVGRKCFLGLEQSPTAGLL